jgi:RNA polymerase sigma-70 factor (ECF subfamily)
MNSNKISDEALFVKIRESNILAFDTLFARYYKNLCFYSNKITGNGEIAEDIVQELFIKIWENRETILIEKFVKSYLYRSVYNRSVNYLRDNKNLKNNVSIDLNTTNHQSYYNADNDILYFELESKLFEIIDSLPEKQKKVFLLKRLENYSYKEIALELCISEKMVEKYLSKAIHKLRRELSEYHSPSSITLLFFLI